MEYELEFKILLITDVETGITVLIKFFSGCVTDEPRIP